MPPLILFNLIQSYSILFNLIQSYSILFNLIQSWLLWNASGKNDKIPFKTTEIPNVFSV
ncbi:hypothetical protein [Helicobacter pylori]|uniref:hypothetical protein n=1 Tax=Helicobacter pylori TaxID=210 RepID=UPI002017AE05|nr:hypothetical protein [Helicobacter pylori]